MHILTITRRTPGIKKIFSTVGQIQLNTLDCLQFARLGIRVYVLNKFESGIVLEPSSQSRKTRDVLSHIPNEKGKTFAIRFVVFVIVPMF